jgi:hypothetical protein
MTRLIPWEFQSSRQDRFQRSIAHRSCLRWQSLLDVQWPTETGAFRRIILFARKRDKGLENRFLLPHRNARAIVLNHDALLFLMLLAISNVLSLRVLKVRRWKLLQRWTYAAFLLTGAHGIAYQWIEKRHVLWVLAFSAIMTAVVAAQFLGFVRLRAQTLSVAPDITEERSPQ